MASDRTEKRKRRDAALRDRLQGAKVTPAQGGRGHGLGSTYSTTANGPLYGGPTRDTDPAEILLAEIRRTSGHIEWLASRIQECDPEMFVKTLWLSKRQSGYTYDSEVDKSSFTEAGAIWLEAYQAERRHLAGIVRTALAAGLEERRVRMAERQAEAIGSAMRGMLYDIGDYIGIAIDPEDENVRDIIFKHLMAVSGAPVPKTKNEILPLAIEPADEWSLSV